MAPSAGLARWQAKGLALAATAMAARGGLGTLVGAVLLASTAELVGSTLGRRGAAFAAILQVTGYVLIAVSAAQAFGLVWTPFDVTDDLYAPVQVNHWLWSLWAVAAIVVDAVLVFALPGGVVAAMVLLAVALIQGGWSLGYVGGLVLRLVMAVGLATMVVLPLLGRVFPPCAGTGRRRGRPD